MTATNGGVQPFATEAGAADAHLPSGPPPGPWRRFDRLVVLAFALAITLPGVLLVARVHTTQVENRAPRKMPRLTVAGLLDATWPAGVDGFLTDHLALRPYAIRLRGEAYWLTGGTGNPMVVRGRDDWLFFRGELDPPCRFTGAEVGANLQAGADALAASGIDFRFLLIPDKHSVYPDKVKPDSPFGRTCEDAGRPDFDAAISGTAGRVIDARPALAAARKVPGTPELYFRQDTHWTPTGAAIAIGELIRSLDPTLWSDPDIVVRGNQPRVMDTAALMGIRRVALTPRVEIRPDIEQHRSDVDIPVAVQNARAVFRITTSGAQRTLPGRTLIVYDSFFGIDSRLVAPYFSETTWVHVNDFVSHPELARLLGPFDRVIVERIERGLLGLDLGPMLAPLAQPGG
jgi:hypothetical protein